MNACYHLVQNLLSYSFLSKKLKINIYRTIILLVVWYGCKTWSLTLREERLFQKQIMHNFHMWIMLLIVKAKKPNLFRNIPTQKFKNDFETKGLCFYIYFSINLLIRHFLFSGFLNKQAKLRHEIALNNVQDQPDTTITIYWHSNQLNTFRAIFCPSSGAQDRVLQHVV